MDDAVLVRMSHRVGDLAKELEPLPRIQVVLSNVILEGDTFNEFHGEERLPTSCPSRLMDRRNTGVLQPRKAVFLTLKQADHPPIEETRLVNDLDRDPALWVILLSFVDNPHAAGSNRPENSVTIDPWKVGFGRRCHADVPFFTTLGYGSRRIEELRVSIVLGEQCLYLRTQLRVTVARLGKERRALFAGKFDGMVEDVSQRSSAV